MGNVVKYIASTLTANTKTHNTADLGDIAYSKVFLSVPTFSTAAEVDVLCSNDGTTFFTALTAVVSGSNGKYIELNYVAPYIKLVTTGTVCAAATAYFTCYP